MDWRVQRRDIVAAGLEEPEALRLASVLLSGERDDMGGRGSRVQRRLCRHGRRDCSAPADDRLARGRRRPAVFVTIGALQSGTKDNVIPDEALLKLNVRTFDEQVRTHVLDAIKRIIEPEATASGAPRPLEITMTEHTR